MRSAKLIDEGVGVRALTHLREKLPAGFERLTYAGFHLELLSSDTLAELKSYRTGLLHRMGIAELQPHRCARRTRGRCRF
jgi:hypothetical protein